MTDSSTNSGALEPDSSPKGVGGVVVTGGAPGLQDGGGLASGREGMLDRARVRSRVRLGGGGWFGVVTLVVMVLACVATLPFTFGRGVDGVARYNSGETSEARVGPWWAGGRASSDTIDETEVIERASSRFWLGSDALGRSVLIRCLAGGGISLAVGLLAALVSVTIGTMVGAVAGYAGGVVDSVLMRTVDVLYGLPYVLLVVLLAVAGDAVVDEYQSRSRAQEAFVSVEARGAMGEAEATDRVVRQWLAANVERAEAFRSEATAKYPPRVMSGSTRSMLDVGILLVAIGSMSWLTLARVVRGQVLSLKALPFVESARAIGMSRTRVFARHLLPNLIGPIVVYATLTVPQAILQESFLSFLGIGIKPPLPSWGNLAAEGRDELNPYQSHWWLLVSPCVLLGVTLLSLNFVGEALREGFDPKRRGR